MTPPPKADMVLSEEQGKKKLDEREVLNFYFRGCLRKASRGVEEPKSAASW